MYKSSNDRRFQKNKKEIQQAFIRLVMKHKGYHNISISEIAKEADINRMTFYAHYDVIEDIFQEFIDDMETEIITAVSNESEFNIDTFFELLNNLMYKEIDFFRFIAKDENCSEFCTAFRKTISKIIVLNNPETDTPAQSLIAGDLIASCIAYAYLDWLAGRYKDVKLDDMLLVVKDMLKDQLKSLKYSDCN